MLLQLSALLLLAAQAHPPVAPAGRPGPGIVEAAQDVDLALFLIGDAGEPAPRGEPVLQALGRELSRAPASGFVVFLGDNLYPQGLPAADDAARPEMERRLDAQVDTVKGAGARGLFVPGNHDWRRGRKGGWDAVRRQVERIDERGAPLVSALPKGGCPGPEVVDAGLWLRLVALDTQWWLNEPPKPMDPTSDCAADSEEEVLSALGRALETAGERRVVVVAHHPLASGGPHGGHFSFRQHVFPLTDVKKNLWIPLPLIGSIYPLGRKGGATPQDMPHPRNARMREALVEVLRGRPPLVFASGHEHALQVFDGPGARHVLVSGAGIYGHSSGVKRLRETRFASSRAGFMRLDVERSGRVRLAVLEVDERGETAEAWSAWLD